MWPLILIRFFPPVWMMGAIDWTWAWSLATPVSWRPGAGDPTFLGWLITIAYGVATLLCVRAGLAAGQTQCPQSAVRRFWWLGAAVLLLLGLNKQLDLQSLLNEVGRQLSESQGWYERRRVFQAAFTLVLAGMAAIGLGVPMVRHWSFFKKHPLFLTGAGLLTLFVLVRASSFEHLFEFLGLNQDTTNWPWALELVGIVCIALAAFRACGNGNEKRNS